MAAAAPATRGLEDVPIDALMAEVQRRMDCKTKQERRLILFGEFIWGVLLLRCFSSDSR